MLCCLCGAILWISRTSNHFQRQSLVAKFQYPCFEGRRLGSKTLRPVRRRLVERLPQEEAARPDQKRQVNQVKLSLLNAGDFPLTELLIDAHLEGGASPLSSLKGANVVDVFACVHTTKPDDPDGGKMRAYAAGSSERGSKTLAPSDQTANHAKTHRSTADRLANRLQLVCLRGCSFTLRHFDLLAVVTASHKAGQGSASDAAACPCRR